MKCRFLTLAVLLAVLAAFAPSSHADVDFEVGLNNGYTNNLLGTVSSQDDSYSTTRLQVKWYPLPQLQLNLGTDYTYYNNLIGLGSNTPRAGLIWVPTAPEGPITLYVEGSISGRRYRSAYGSYDTNEGFIKASLGCTPASGFQVRYGFKFTGSNYITPDSSTDADNEQYELFAGANATLPGKTSFDLETGLGLTNFAFIDADAHPTFQSPYAALQLPGTQFLDEGDFRAFYISPRLSRSFGNRTGVSLTYVYREFIDTEDAVVLGLTTNFLSPWAAYFEGSSVQLRIKTFLLPGFITTGGVGYWDKTYLRSTEYFTRQRELFPGYVVTETLWIDPEDASSRKDEMTRIYIGLQRPFSFGGGSYFEPSFGLEYIDNNSTHSTYDYSTTAVTFNILFRP